MLEYELTYEDVAIQLVNHITMEEGLSSNKKFQVIFSIW